MNHPVNERYIMSTSDNVVKLIINKYMYKAVQQRGDVYQNTNTINEIFALVGWYAAYICSYRPFGTTYRPPLQASSIGLVVSSRRFGTTYRFRKAGKAAQHLTRTKISDALQRKPEIMQVSKTTTQCYCKYKMRFQAPTKYAILILTPAILILELCEITLIKG
jgi:hypothetical protein